MPIPALCSLQSILLAAAPLGGTLHVSADYPTIQACIDAAVSGVDECVVAPGAYNETINFLGKAITLRSSGGRDVTTIDATGIGGSVVTCASGEGPDSVLDGFTITGGTGTDVSGYTYGGGMYNDHGNPIVINCAFSGNTAYFGGGWYNLASNPTVTNCTISANTASGTYAAGGGMYNSGSSPNMTNCEFTVNEAERHGGGMYNEEGSTPNLADCTFNGNTAQGNGGGGGGMYNYRSAPTVIGCSFSGNKSDHGFGGGGMYNNFSSPNIANSDFTGNTARDGGGIYNYYSAPTLVNCTFRDNTVSFYGGGMYNYTSSPTVTNCTFRMNMTTGLYGGGGMYNAYGSNSTVTNCTFSANTASGTYGGGGGMYNNSSNPRVTNCTFRGNTASGGGGMYNYNHGSPTLTNCILWGNSPDELRNVNLSTPSILFNDVQGGLPAGAIDDGGNINLDPMFVRPPDPGPDGTWNGVDDDYGDLRLQAGSPCINAGDPAFMPLPGETDLDGHARELCDRVDMGAYEFGIGDYDCDQTVDLTDFAQWPACMTGPSTADTAVPHASGCEPFAFDGDVDVDLFDFAGFQLGFEP